MREIESYSDKYVQGWSLVEESKHTNSYKRRQTGRLVNTDLQCSLGEIQNISASGMEILCQDSAPYSASVLIGFDEDRICVSIKRIWVKHLESQKRLVGYQFVAIPPIELFIDESKDARAVQITLQALVTEPEKPLENK